MFLVSVCSCLCTIYWSQILSGEWRCSWSSADRRCSNYIWVINNLIACQSASYIKDLTVCLVYCEYFVVLRTLCYNSTLLRDDFRLAPSQWEMSLQSNALSHWLGVNLESTLALYIDCRQNAAYFQQCINKEKQYNYMQTDHFIDT